MTTSPSGRRYWRWPSASGLANSARRHQILPNPLTLGQQIIAAALAAFIVFAAGAWTGGKLVNNHWKAKEADRLEAEQAEYARLTEIAQGLGRALAEETAKRQADTRRLRAEVEKSRNHESVQVDCPAPGVRLVIPSAVRFGADFVDTWNAGLCVGLPAAAGACRPAGASVGPNPVTPATLINNAIDNAEACNADRARLRAAQNYLKEIGAAR